MVDLLLAFPLGFGISEIVPAAGVGPWEMPGRASGARAASGAAAVDAVGVRVGRPLDTIPSAVEVVGARAG